MSVISYTHAHTYRYVRPHRLSNLSCHIRQLSSALSLRTGTPVHIAISHKSDYNPKLNGRHPAYLHGKSTPRVQRFILCYCRAVGLFQIPEIQTANDFELEYIYQPGQSHQPQTGGGKGVSNHTSGERANHTGAIQPSLVPVDERLPGALLP